MEFIKKHKMEIINIVPFVVFFFVMFYFSQSATIMSDDVRYSLRSSFNYVLPPKRITNVFQTFESAWYDYNSINGRFLTSALIMNVLISGPYLFYFLNPLIHTLTLFFGLLFIKGKFFDSKKDLLINSVVILSYFSIVPCILDECVFWITGSITYSWPVLFLLLLLAHFLKGNNLKWYFDIPFIIIALYLGCTVENTSITTTFIFFFISIYNFFIKKDKKFFNKSRILILLSLLCSNIFQMCSPGMWNRAGIVSGDSTLISNIIKGVYSFFEYQYNCCGIIPLVLILLISICLRKYNKIFSNILLIIAIPFTIISIIHTIPNETITLQCVESGIFVEQTSFCKLEGYKIPKLLMTAYYGLLTIAIAASVVYIYFRDNDEKKILLIMLSTMPIIIMIPLGWGVYRASYLPQIFMILSCGSFLYDLLNNNIRVMFVITFCFIFSLICFVHKVDYLSSNVEVGKTRNKIYENITEETQVSGLTIPRYRYSIQGNFEDIDSREYQEFKNNYIGLSSEIHFVNRDEFNIK